MKKISGIILAAVTMAAVSAQSIEAEPKVWNNGSTEYIPLGTEFHLEAENWNPDLGTIIYTHNAGNPVEYTEPVALTEEGTVVLSWVTMDLWGNVSNAKTYTAVVDGTAPEIKYMLNGPSYMDADGIFYATKDTGFQIFGEDALAGTERLYLDMGTGEIMDVTGSGLLYLTDIPDGPVSASCTAVDYVGNVSAPVEATVYVDNTAPSVYIDIDIPPVEVNGVQYVSPATKFTLSAEDALSGVEGIYISVNGSEFAKYDAMQPLSPDEPGNYILQVYAKDNLGNTSDISEMTFSTNLALPPAELILNPAPDQTEAVPAQLQPVPVSGEK